MTNDDFYLRLENEFRGSRLDIKQRGTAYLPIIEPLKSIYPEGVVVDLGCGRGEWLELLQENGWCVQGIDTNSDMVEMCQSLGLPVQKIDALEYLRSQKDNSIAIVSGFHIVEHLPFESLLELIKDSFRTLLPGGILILETPNPENNILRARNFYLDPSHRNPLPPVLMQFLAKDCGFSKSVILRLNGPREPAKDEPLSRQVFWALSANPDYGLVAQKQPGPDMLDFTAFNEAGSEQVDGIAILENAIIRFEKEMGAVQNELNQKTSELVAAMAARETERLHLESALAAKEAERQESKKDLTWSEGERQRLEVALKAREVDRWQLEAALNGKEIERLKLETILGANEATRNRLESALAEMETERQGLKKDLAWLEGERHRLESAFAVEEIERVQLETSLKAKEIDFLQLETSLKAKEIDFLQLETSLKAKEIDRLHLETNLIAKEARRLQLETALDAKEGELWQLETALKAKEADFQELKKDLTWSEGERQLLEAILNGFRTSRSWQITMPFRKMHDFIWWVPRSFKGVIKKTLVQMMLFVERHASLKIRSMRLLNRFPNLKIQLRGLAITSGIMQSATFGFQPAAVSTADESQNLTRKAQQIYKDLLEAFEKNEGVR